MDIDSRTSGNAELANAVQVVKNAILQSQQRALVAINQEQLALYYGIGRYISENTRNGSWGNGILEAISAQLRKELPGLRGFSVPNLRKMRLFYEEWQLLSDNSFVPTNELANEQQNSFVPTNELPIVQFKIEADFPISAFLNIGFTHHYEIISKVKDIEERKPNENPSIGIILCRSANKKFVEYVIQDYDRPMGVATYKTAADMDERLKRLLPSVEDLEKLL